MCLCFVKTLDVLQCIYFLMIVSCKLKLDWRAVCVMLVKCNLSAWALVAVSLNTVERKRWLREAVSVSFMPEKENSLALGSSWAILFGCRSYFLLGMVYIRDVCPGRGEQIYLLKEWITPRDAPHLLPCWMAGQPLAAPRCCHSKVYYSAISFFRWVAWHSFPCKAVSFLPWRPLCNSALWQCLQKVCPQESRCQGEALQSSGASW